MSNPIGNLTEYELHHLAEHLESSGRADDLHHLFALETSEQHNAWFEAKEAVGDTDGYQNDIVRTWNLISRSRSRSSVGQQSRYALIIASMNSLAENIPPSLIAALVGKHVWTPSQGRAYARQIPDPVQRRDALAKLSPHLQRPGEDEAEVTTKTPGVWITQEEESGLETNVSQEQEPGEGKDYWKQETGKGQGPAEDLRRNQEQALRESWRHMQEQAQDKQNALAQERARAYADRQAEEKESQDTLAEEREEADILRSGLPMPYALDSPISFWDLDSWDEDTELPSEPPPELVEGIRDTEHAAEDEGWLEGVVAWQNKFEIDLYPVYAIEDEYLRAEALYELGLTLESQYHPEEDLKVLLEATSNISNETSRERALSGIASGIAGTNCSDCATLALEVLQGIGNVQTRIEAASEVARKLAVSCSECGGVIHSAESLIEDENERDRFVCEFLSEWYDGEEALAVALSIERRRLRTEAISTLAPCLSETSLRQALEAIRIINDSELLAEALSLFTFYIDERVEFDTPDPAGDKSTEAELSIVTSPELTEKMLREALDSVQAIEDQDERALAISQLIPELSELPMGMLYSLWESALRVLVVRSRRQVLRDLRVLAPVIDALGAHEAIEETCRAIQDVGHWWP